MRRPENGLVLTHLKEEASVSLELLEEPAAKSNKTNEFSPSSNPHGPLEVTSEGGRWISRGTSTQCLLQGFLGYDGKYTGGPRSYIFAPETEIPHSSCTSDSGQETTEFVKR